MQRSTTALWLTLVCCLSQFLHTVYGSVVNIALPAISRDLGAGVEDLQWLVNAYVLTLASTLTLAGTVADRFGRRRILVLGNLVMVAGSVVCALSDAVPQLVAGRVIQGAGSALIAPAGLALLTAAFPRTAARAVAVMWWTTIGTASLAAGPILGGLLVRDLGWQSVFWAGVPLGVAAAVLALVLLHESLARTRVPFDPVGQALLTVFLATLAFTLTEGSHLGWSSPAIVGSGAVALVALVLLVPFELRHANPVVPVRLLARPRFATALSTAVVGYLALAGLLFLNTFALQAARGLDATTAGLLTIPLAVGATTSALLAARFVARGRSRQALLLSGVLVAAGSVGLSATDTAPLWTVVVPYLVFGLGFGFIADPVSVTALGALGPDEAGLASSLISTSKQAGQMLGIATVGALLASSGATDQRAEFAASGGAAWALLTVAGVVIVALNLWHARTPAPRAA